MSGEGNEARTSAYQELLNPPQGSLPNSTDDTVPEPLVGPKWEAKAKPSCKHGPGGRGGDLLRGWHPRRGRVRRLRGPMAARRSGAATTTHRGPRHCIAHVVGGGVWVWAPGLGREVVVGELE